ncbi:hypothetical protein G9A89_021820 [Geosiphon pyriformis]|nr:hypothetical protein G9A89_021820 [Geosiphon pyriformis]
MDMAQQIEDNQRMHLEFTFLVFTLAFQIAATSFAAQTPDSNKQLIDRLTANLAWLLELLAQAVRDNQQLQRPKFEFHFNQLQQPPYQRQQNCGLPVCYCYKLTINTSESTKKKKKTKIDFVLDPNKASISTTKNNKPSKTKVFKNSPKLKPPEIVQKFGPYSVVKDLMKIPAHITFGQQMTHPQFKKDLYKSLILKKKTPKTNKCSHQAKLTNNSNVTPLICKAQVAGYFINLILNSRSSVSVIAKHFFEAIGKKIDEFLIRPIINIHGSKKKN